MFGGNQGCGLPQQIAHETGAAAPDLALCKRGYAEAKAAGAKDWCEANKPKDTACLETHLRAMADWDRSPSIVVFPVEVKIGSQGGIAQPTGAPTACYQSE